MNRYWQFDKSDYPLINETTSANADADPTAPPHDSLRKFNYEGENSDCELDSICSDDMEEPDWRIDQLDREFKNIGNLFKGAEAEQDDLYDDDDDQYSMHD